MRLKPLLAHSRGGASPLGLFAGNQAEPSAQIVMLPHRAPHCTAFSRPVQVPASEAFRPFSHELSVLIKK